MEGTLNLEDLVLGEDVVGEIWLYRIYYYQLPHFRIIRFKDDMDDEDMPTTDMQMQKYMIVRYGVKFPERLLTLWASWQELKKRIVIVLLKKSEYEQRHMFCGLSFTKLAGKSYGMPIYFPPVTSNILECPGCGSKEFVPNSNYSNLRMQYGYEHIHKFPLGCRHEFCFTDCYRISFEKLRTRKEDMTKFNTMLRNTEDYLDSLRHELKECIDSPETQQFLNEKKRLEHELAKIRDEYRCGISLAVEHKIASVNANRFDNRMGELTRLEIEIEHKIKRLKKDFWAN